MQTYTNGHPASAARRDAGEIAEALGIRLKSLGNGTQSTTCPQCSARRSAAGKSNTCLSVLIDGDGLRWNCHHCGWKGGEFYEARRADTSDPNVPTWHAIVPVPDGVRLKFPRHKNGEPNTVWDYRDSNGRLLGHVCRWDTGDGGKEVMPLSWCVGPDGSRAWRWMALPTPRPLYGRDQFDKQPDAPVLVVEGEKSADAAAKRFSDHVAVTSSGGAKAADKADWTPLAGRHVVIWPDHDEPGGRYAADVARLAAKAGAATVRIVAVPSSWPEGWDLADALPEGITAETLRELLTAAKPANAETARRSDAETQAPAEPVPLVRPMPPADAYPIHGLGSQLAEVACALQEIVQSPQAMCANSVLAVVTLAAQAHIDVALPIGAGSVRPVSSLFLTVGRSGERKSATDDIAMRAVKAHEAGLRTTWEIDAKAHKNAHDAWEAERKGILGSKPSAKQSNVDRVSREADLRAMGDEPQPPLLPIMTMAEPTIEGLAKLLMAGQPSVGVFSAEGGQFVGGHALSDDAKLRSAAALSHLWDGETWKRVRSLDGASTIANRRLAMHLMVQPDVAAQLLNDPVLRDQGLASRMLVTFPATTMGTRLHRDPSAEALATVTRFTARMTAALSLPMPIRDGTRNELSPRPIRFSPDAARVWIEFSDHIERMIAPGKQLEPISGFAAKMAEHAARLAAVIAWWEDHASGTIDAATLRGAIRIVEHHGDEALRLWQASVVPPDIADAQRLQEWLRDRWDGPLVSIPDITQLGPNSVRVARRARELVGILAEHGWLLPQPGGGVIRGKRRREAWAIWGRALP